mmetsp:Transcript_38149/g.73167  ORF Transcript_38149/g.73167 Transcript_38149/m.73167 type:complete len:126 (+) Transcript_38149:207-584(+)|eukprot:CAMPEP_0114237782 /NCGR_PEP_ID=MMETSP0058-20121206/7574_1 /TAXON_ID=36894 /ORGANISM="Pyramimonas parkeae, CCMP726" /LENGTH=125 /DNA_ID=CAMNT_0001349847 /DNA_START=185 /DNA_END=562 /DNA_ORIENTATION=+
MDLSGFESRASEAEARLAALEAHIGGGVSGGDMAFRAEVLKELFDLRTKLGSAKHQFDAVIAERDEAKAKIQFLEKNNEKLEYRVKHLVRALKESDDAYGPPGPPVASKFEDYQAIALKKGEVVK